MAAITCPGIVNGWFTDRPARVLPRLAGVVPVKAKLRQRAGNRGRLLIGKLNPNPFAPIFGLLPVLTCSGRFLSFDLEFCLVVFMMFFLCSVRFRPLALHRKSPRNQG